MNHPAIPHPIADLIARCGGVVVDGAMSTALESLGADLNDSLWSAKVLVENPDLSRQVHLDYYRSGANVAITASYQATAPGFAKKGIGEAEARRLIALSVALAKEAREAYLLENPAAKREDLLVAGAVGPYGAYLADASEYTGKYRLTRAEYEAFHAVRIEALLSAEPDLLAIETQPRLDEIEAILGLLRNKPISAWVTMTLGEDGKLPDGTPVEEAARVLDAHPNVEAVGFNCLPQARVADALQALGRGTSKPLIVYPNSGEIYDPTTKTWHHPPAGGKHWSDLVPLWRAAGARCIGGCCRTLPRDITEIAKLMAAR